MQLFVSCVQMSLLVAASRPLRPLPITSPGPDGAHVDVIEDAMRD